MDTLHQTFAIGNFEVQANDMRAVEQLARQLPFAA
ncbi:hypothetical protein RCH06_002062 [Polaromonas sp. CG_9.5]|nr:hypothetical protein [Polaromonas sp. CG_9.5]